MTSQDSQRGKLLSPLRHRDFRLFWTGLLLSSVGSQFTQVAMAWQIYELTNSPLQIGMIGLVRAVPQMFILLFGGLLADAMNRRKLMMVTQGSLFFVSGALALLTLGGHVTPLKLYGITVFLALFSSLEAPSRQAIVTNLVPAEDLSRALAIFSTQRQIATIAGPSIAGVDIGDRRSERLLRGRCHLVAGDARVAGAYSRRVAGARGLAHDHAGFAARGFSLRLGACRHISIS